MEQEPESYIEDDGLSGPGEHVLGPRRRIVAHEVKSASLTTLSPSDLPNEQLRASGLDRPAQRFDTTIVDPTVEFGTRRRRRKSRWAHRLTTSTAIGAFVAASLSIAILLGNDREWAATFAVAGLVLAGASMYFSRSHLAQRRRGYAVAALVFALIAVALNLDGDAVHDSVTESKTTVYRHR